jgi:fibrillarin-like rRNA methylase
MTIDQIIENELNHHLHRINIVKLPNGQYCQGFNEKRFRKYEKLVESVKNTYPLLYEVHIPVVEHYRVLVDRK